MKRDLIYATKKRENKGENSRELVIMRKLQRCTDRDNMKIDGEETKEGNYSGIL